MYFVDREKILQTLDYIEQNYTFLGKLSIEDKVQALALERISHMMIEAILDVGNAMIDGFIMRDPGGYEDIIDILLDEKVITDEQSSGLKEIISYRKVLVQDYLQIDHKKLYKTFTEMENHILSFPTQVKRYLEEELGPVSAFRS